MFELFNLQVKFHLINSSSFSPYYYIYLNFLDPQAVALGNNGSADYYRCSPHMAFERWTN